MCEVVFFDCFDKLSNRFPVIEFIEMSMHLLTRLSSTQQSRIQRLLLHRFLLSTRKKTSRLNSTNFQVYFRNSARRVLHSTSRLNLQLSILTSHTAAKTSQAVQLQQTLQAAGTPTLQTQAHTGVLEAAVQMQRQANTYMKVKTAQLCGVVGQVTLPAASLRTS